MKTLLSIKGIRIAISDIHDGNMRFFDSEKYGVIHEDEQEIISSQNKLTNAINANPEMVARVRTIYSNRNDFTFYEKITHKNISKFSIKNSESKIPVTDGLVTDDPEIGFLLPLADCLGIVVYDEIHHALGLLHAGRHNIEQNGPAKFIEYFCSSFKSDPKNLRVYFSPCAQEYEITKLNNQKMPDAATKQLSSVGIDPCIILRSEIDTVTNPDYPSCSAGDKNKRFAIITKQLLHK